jgi:hypothetical protein
LIWGEGLENISILGPGRIYGKGPDPQPEPAHRQQGHRLEGMPQRDYQGYLDPDGRWFAILATGVDNMTIDNVKIDTNRDGMDIDSDRNVRISNVSVNSPNDDGICLKSDYALGFARATENVTITNSQVSGYGNGTFLDGTYQRKTFDKPDSAGPTRRVKFGTESNGGYISDGMYVYDTRYVFMGIPYTCTPRALTAQTLAASYTAYGIRRTDFAPGHRG